MATEVLGEYPALFERYWLAGMRTKLGLQTRRGRRPRVDSVAADWMQKCRADFTNTFRDLSSEEPPAGDRYQDPDFLAWHAQWQLRLSREGRPSTVGLRRDARPSTRPSSRGTTGWRKHSPPRRTTTISRCCSACWRRWRRRMKQQLV